MRALDRFLLVRLLQRSTLVLLVIVCLLAAASYAFAQAPPTGRALASPAALIPASAAPPGLPR